MQEDQAPGSSRLPLLCASVAGFIAFVLTWRLLGLQTHALELPGGQSEVMDSVLAVVPAVAKVAPIALSLAAGWRGGDFFPLMLAGGAAGAATLALLPATGALSAVVAGMAAATTIGVRRPLAVLVLVWFLVPQATVLALAVACLVATLALKTLPQHPALTAQGH